jgi:hypothetical protein
MLSAGGVPGSVEKFEWKRCFAAMDVNFLSLFVG